MPKQPKHNQILIEQDAESLAERAAGIIAQAAADAIAQRGRFTLALAGGSTPTEAYQLLAKRPHEFPVDWSRSLIFWSDERFVPFDSPDSNYGAAKRALLDPAGVPEQIIFSVPTHLASADSAATDYEETLLAQLAQEGQMGEPRFDLILLGLGQDGHTASLFPNAPALQVTERMVVATHSGALPPHVDRVTFTVPLINAARAVLFLVSGSVKADAVHRVIELRDTSLPATLISPKEGSLTWLLDDGAASLLDRGAIKPSL